MLDVDKKLKSVLEAATGLKAHPIKKPLSAAVPCLVYRRVSNHDTIAHTGNAGLTTDRLQVICTHTTYSGLKTLVGQVEGVLIANNTDWEVSIPAGNKLDDYDEDDKIYSTSADYFITYN